MKRIKADEIQETLKNYLKQRNLTLRNTSLSVPNVQNPRPSPNQPLDLNKIILTDSALVESSINDYYSYCLNSPSFETDYFKEFESLKHFVQQHSESSLSKILYPILVYMCIDLITIGISIKDKVKKLFDDVPDQEEVKPLVDDLILLEESKEKWFEIKELVENKWRIYLNSIEWRTFLNFFINSRCYLLLRIVNLNLQIIKVDGSQSSMDIDEIQTLTLFSETKLVKTNQSQDSSESIKKSIVNPRTSIDGSISLKSLRESIQMIRCKPPTINGACCFYLSDPHHKITSSTMSPDYRYASFTSEDSSIYLYDLASATNNSSVKLNGGHSNTVLKSRFTHDSSYLLSCDFDGLACLWRMSNVTDRHHHHHHHNQSSILPVVSYSGHLYPIWDIDPFSSLNLFATASKDASARLWSFDRLYPLRVYAGHHADVNCVRFHPNASYLATASSDKTVRLWSVQSCEFVRLFSGHRGRVFALAFSPDGNYLASAGEDKKVKIWDLRMGTQLKEFRGHANFIHSLAFDNHSQVLCSGGLDKTLKFWDFTGQVKTDGKTTTAANLKPPASQSSNDLLSSTQLEFDVYSVSVDSHNVFYACGARKEAVVVGQTTPNVEFKEEKVERGVVVEKCEGKIEMLTSGEGAKNFSSSPQTSETTRKVGVSTRKSSASAKNVAPTTNNTATPNTTPNTNPSNINYDFLNNDDLYEV